MQVAQLRDNFSQIVYEHSALVRKAKEISVGRYRRMSVCGIFAVHSPRHICRFITARPPPATGVPPVELPGQSLKNKTQYDVEFFLVDKDRMKEIIEAMHKLAEESRRLTNAHNEVMREYERLKTEYEKLRRSREG